LSVAWVAVVGTELEVTVVDAEAEVTVEGVELDGVAVGGPLEQPAAKTASPITMKRLAFIGPPRWPT
jgi:hypothetical protein